MNRLANTNKTNISAIIPVYNSEPTLEELHRRLTSTLGNISDNYEIIMIDDASRDGSWAKIEQLASLDNRVVGIQLSRNYGQHSALLCGIRSARYEMIVTLDDDLQNPPEEIHKLIDKYNEGYDVVYGRPLKDQHDLFRNISSQLTKLILQNAMHAETARNISSFRAFRKKISTIFENYQGAYVNIDVLLTWGTTKFAAVGVKHNKRKVGKTTYTLRKLVNHTLNMLTGFSTIPLKIASLTGFVFTIFGVGILLFVVGRWVIQGSAVPGFAFLASVIVLFAGAQLFALGIIGEYIARIHSRSMEKPVYNIRTTTAAQAIPKQSVS